MHGGDLDGSTAVSGSNKWIATVVITVHDKNHNPLQGVTVNGRWSDAGNGGGGPNETCITNASGQCTVATNDINNSTDTTTFELRNNGLVLSGYAYISGNNHDPDFDSTGTLITLYRPGIVPPTVTPSFTPTLTFTPTP
jgi:hypothetical protein